MATAKMKVEKEIWKSPPSLKKPWVEVSNLGRVRTLDRYVDFVRKNDKSVHHDFRKGCIRKLSCDSRGRPMYTMSNGKSRLVRVLVAECFVPNDNPELNKFVFHKDGNPHNCRADNLVWGRKKSDFYFSGRPVGLFLDGQKEPMMVGSLCSVAEHIGCTKQAVHRAIQVGSRCFGWWVRYLPKGTEFKDYCDSFPDSLYK
jgi:hypothetical protein